MPAFNDYANRLGILQRPYLGKRQLRENGNMSAGTSGINVTQPGTVSKSPPVVDYLSKVAMQGGVASPNVQPGTKVQSGGFVTGAALSIANGASGASNQSGQAGVTVSPEYASDYQGLMTQLQAINDSLGNFKYDSSTDPAYLAAVQKALEGAKVAKSNTIADMADRGILNSSVTSAQLGDISRKAEMEPLQLLPQLEANAYNRFSEGARNKTSIISTMLGQINADRSFNADQSWHEADVSGSYESPEMIALMNSIVGYKQDWANAKTPEERTKAAENAKVARASLASLTGRSPADIDKLFGANVGVDMARGNFGLSGIETAQAKASRQGQENWTKNFDEGVRHDRVMESKVGRGGGGGSNGLTFDQLLKSNTNRMVTSMLSDPKVKSINDVSGWIRTHRDDILQAGINPDEFYNSAKLFLSGDSQIPVVPSGNDLNKMALEAAYKDPSWDRADTPEKQQEIINKWKDYYQQPGGNGTGGGVDPLDALLNFGQKIVPWAFKSKTTVPTGGAKAPTKTGGGKARHSAN